MCMHQTNKKIGQLIHQIRQERGLTQAELARRLGTSQSAVNRIEHGKQNLSIDTLQRISNTLNYPIITLSEPGKPRVDIEGDFETGKLVVVIHTKPE